MLRYYDPLSNENEGNEGIKDGTPDFKIIICRVKYPGHDVREMRRLVNDREI